MNARVAAHFGAKVAFVSGTDAGVTEMQACIAGLPGYACLRSCGRASAENVGTHPEHLRRLQREVKRAVFQRDAVGAIERRNPGAVTYEVRLLPAALLLIAYQLLC